MLLAELVDRSTIGQALRERRGWLGLGVQVSTARSDARLFIQAVADRANLSWSRVRSIETGAAEPPPSDAELVAIARALDVPSQPFLDRARRVREGRA